MRLMEENGDYKFPALLFLLLGEGWGLGAFPGKIVLQRRKYPPRIIRVINTGIGEYLRRQASAGGLFKHLGIHLAEKLGKVSPPAVAV